jgi:hypothetical protein
MSSKSRSSRCLGGDVTADRRLERGDPRVGGRGVELEIPDQRSRKHPAEIGSVEASVTRNVKAAALERTAWRRDQGDRVSLPASSASSTAAIALRMSSPATRPRI